MSKQQLSLLIGLGFLLQSNSLIAQQSNTETQLPNLSCNQQKISPNITQEQLTNLCGEPTYTRNYKKQCNCVFLSRWEKHIQ